MVGAVAGPQEVEARVAGSSRSRGRGAAKKRQQKWQTGVQEEKQGSSRGVVVAGESMEPVPWGWWGTRVEQQK